MAAATDTGMLFKDAGNTWRIERRFAAGLCAGFTALSVIVAAIGRVPGPDLTYAFPAAAILWSLCDLLTAFLLFAQFYVRRRIALGIVGSAYALSGILTWPYLCAYLGLFGTSARTIGDQQIPASLYLLWHAIFPLAAILAYWNEPAVAGVPRQIIAPVATIWTAAVLVTCAAITAYAYAFRDHLPVFVIHGLFQPAYWFVGIPTVIMLSIAGCLVMLTRHGDLRGIRLWLAVAMLTSLLDAALNEVSPIRFSYAWDAGKLLTLTTASVMMTGLLAGIVRTYAQISELLGTQSHQAASRMRALWQIATSEGLSELDHVQMILEVAAANIRVSGNVFAFVSHREGDEIVVDAVGESGEFGAFDRSAQTYSAGSRFALAADVHDIIAAANKTCYWDNLPQRFDGLLCVAAGWESAIGTPIHVGNETHFLLFGLLRAVEAETFTESDVAFVEVVASSVGHRFYQRAQLDRLQHQIDFDSLTELYNRTKFVRFARAAIADKTLQSVILINLDNFRHVNETVGQMVADELLVEIAASLRGVDERDVVARLGGDDFAVLLKRVRGADALASRLEAYEAIFRKKFHTGDRDGTIFVRVTASLGIMPVEATGLSFEAIMARADIALDRSKQRGGDCMTVFGKELESIVVDRTLEGNELIAALDNGEFALAYQPTYELNTRTIVGAEALIRWRHPNRGIIAPDAFLPSAKRANLLVRLTIWVIERIVADLGDVATPAGFRCYFNVPADVLANASFLVALENILNRTPGIANRLGLEITESDVISDVELAILTLTRFRRLGLFVAIDDFGTGYSSLSYLKRLPVDIVKLDKSFIDGLPDDARDVSIAQMFFGLTQTFAFISVGEGIETERQAGWLLDHGCMIGQGYLFSRPIAFDAMMRLLAANLQALAD